MKKNRAALIGIGGFGGVHVNTMLGLVDDGLLDIVAFAEVNLSVNQAVCDKLTAIGAVHYTDYEQMLAEHPETDFVVIATPIAAHKPMCVRVLEMGFHVLVEKPPATTIQELDEMIATQQRSGRLCQVNFQLTSGKAFRTMLDRLASGAIGKITHVTGVGMWKRTKSYYERTNWAGKLIHNGTVILDGTFNNPLAHLLNNCLITASGDDLSGSTPVSVQAELYHVNDIEGDDTSCIRVHLKNGAIVHFYAMLSHEENATPYIRVQGSEGEAYWDYSNTFTIRGPEGDEHISFDEENNIRNMYLNMMQVIEGDGQPLYCSIESCRNYVLTSNGAYYSTQVIRAIPPQYYEEHTGENTTLRTLPSLSKGIKDAAEKRLLFSEYPFPWAVPTKPFRMENYSKFVLPEGMMKG